ncbi:MAG: radical SAM protein [Bacteroidales bacterium]|nr:radical SAM protein [Bacteroidales bacterium]
MEFSAHNIISRITESDQYYIINLLSGEADIISQDIVDSIKSGKALSEPGMIEKGYVVDPAAEAALFRQRYLDFIDNRETDEVQLFFVPGYQCNFNCSYCYQDDYQNIARPVSEEVVDGFFNYVDLQFKDRKKYLTLFGGEPLLPGEGYREFFEQFIERANERNLDIAIVTNAYNLEEYIPILEKARIREIQVTLDGVGEAHDRRRPLRNGTATFGKIVSGIDAALKADFPVNLRMVLDKENVNELQTLAHFAIDRQWTASPLFKTQLGRNYELHHCQRDADRLYTRIGLYEDIYGLIKKDPAILEFHRPSFSISRFLFDEGELPDPLFDSCPGTKTEWAFDYSGKIYSCTATVGKEGEELGTFYPHINLLEDVIAEWESRDVLAIPECRSCNLRLACGGGCGSVARNQKGSILKPDCRPVQELVSLGLANYFREELADNQKDKN